jgi:hypothetical protein
MDGVVVADISKEAAERVAGEVGSGATAVTADMGDEGQVRSMVEGSWPTTAGWTSP